MSTHRTTLVLPLKLKQVVMSLAQGQGVSFGEFVRQALEKAADSGAKRKKRSDSFGGDHAVFRGDVPRDLSKRHDRYLYGE